MVTNEYQMWVTKYVCADCDPSSGDSEFAEAYVVFVHKGQACPLSHCPQCEGYLGFTEMGDYLATHSALIRDSQNVRTAATGPPDR